MKKKELKNLAKRIADYEYIIQKNENEQEVENARNEIMRLSGMIHNFEDLDLMDELVQKFLAKKIE